MDAALSHASVEAAGNSALLVIGLSAAVVEILVGVAIGWWLRGGKKLAAGTHENQLNEAEHALTNLHELTHRVKADVGAHSSQVEAISNELNAQNKSGTAPDTKVLSAVTKILEANQRLAEQLQSAESRLLEQAEQIKLHATHALTDALTGLGNRRAFDFELDRRVGEFHRYGNSVCLLMLDVDHFKKFNDTHGHLAGDEVLRMVGRTLQSAVRTADFVARYGGEEFAIVAPQSTFTEALAGAERVREAIQRAQCEFKGKKLNVTVSIGLAQMDASQNAAMLVQSADQALYAAKQGGRNQVQILKPNPDAPKAAPATPAAATHEKAALSSQRPTCVDVRTDAQTGLPNRTSFCEDVRRRLAETKRHGHRLSIILIKVDGLREFVAKFGLPMEDLILRTCTQFLSAAMRDMDLVARHDADTFAIVLPGTALVHASSAAERLRTAIARCPLQLQDHKFGFTVSAGVAEAAADEDIVAFMTRAEEANQASRTGGGNRVHFHTGTSVEPVPNETAAAE